MGNIDGAFRKILKDGDTLSLIRLLDTTGLVVRFLFTYHFQGSCLDRLQSETATLLFSRFIVFLKTNCFLGTVKDLTILLKLFPDQVFPWLHQAIGIGVVPLTPLQNGQLVKALTDIASDTTPNAIEAGNLFAELRNMI